MCGIFGYTGQEEALPKLQQGLQRLEYRGYDSAGFVIHDNESAFEICKSVGKVSDLIEKSGQKYEKLTNHKSFVSGIAHTRRATHGVASEANTHPHYDRDKKFFVVHNGIIENHLKLKKMVQKDTQYAFYSDTDTEVIPVLLQKNRTGNLLTTVEKILPLLHGAYAMLIMSSLAPGEIIGVKLGSPLIFGLQPSKSEFFFSSDLQALGGYVSNIIHLKDGELVHISKDNYTIKYEGKHIQKELDTYIQQHSSEAKGDFATFMHKEIFEQPAILQRASKGRVNFSQKSIYSNSVEFLKDKKVKKVIFVGCGTSYHAGALGALWMQDYAKIPSSAHIASEYIYSTIDIDPSTVHIFLSQSGETADSIEVLKFLKEKGCICLGIVNSPGSTIATLTDCGFYMRAGFEVGVASTKAFTAQLMHILFIVLFLGQKSHMPYKDYIELIDILHDIPGIVQEALGTEKDIKRLATQFTQYTNMFFIGRKYQYIIAKEASLKMKEISYIHSEAYPSGELKHGSLALIEQSFPTILIAPNDELFDLNMSSLAEIQSRQGKVLVISDKKIDHADWYLQVPSAHPICMAFITTIATQLLAYHVANNLGREIDKPRNLAKSVTVR